MARTDIFCLVITGFDVQQTSTSVRIGLTFDNDVSGMSGCFFDKLTFLNSAGEAVFTPRYPGLCDFSSQSRDSIIGTMDIVDFVETVLFQILTSTANSIIAIRGESPVSLIPGISVNPTSVPVNASNFILFTGRPSLISFDVDFSTNQILLHFDSLVNTTTLDVTQLLLSSVATAAPTESVALTGASAVFDPYVTTVCITLTANDSTLITERGVCQTSCYCSINDTFILDYGSNSVMSTDALQVWSHNH